MGKFIPYDRTQTLLLPHDLRDWISDDDLVHFIIEATERVDIRNFQVNWVGSWKAQYHLRIVLALWFIATPMGFSPPADSSAQPIGTL